MVLSGINIYPIKSTKGISLETAFVEERGIQFDRRWMVVDEAGVFLSQRDYPRLALVVTMIKPDGLCVDAPGMPTLTLPVKPKSNEIVKVRVHDDITKGVSAGEEAGNWFSDFLGVSCRVVFMPDEIIRPVDPDYARENDIVSYADAFPLLLISQPSLDDLNSRLAVPVPMNRFRPNVVISGCRAFDEDKWKKILVGDTVFHVTKPCSRCVTTTVDQTTGFKARSRWQRFQNIEKSMGKFCSGRILFLKKGECSMSEISSN